MDKEKFRNVGILEPELSSPRDEERKGLFLGDSFVVELSIATVVFVLFLFIVGIGEANAQTYYTNPLSSLNTDQPVFFAEGAEDPHVYDLNNPSAPLGSCSFSSGVELGVQGSCGSPLYDKGNFVITFENGLGGGDCASLSLEDCRKSPYYVGESAFSVNSENLVAIPNGTWLLRNDGDWGSGIFLALLGLASLIAGVAIGGMIADAMVGAIIRGTKKTTNAKYR